MEAISSRMRSMQTPPGKVVAKLDMQIVEVKSLQSLEVSRRAVYSSPLSPLKLATQIAGVMSRSAMFPALAAALCVAIVACGDVTSPRAALPTFSDSASVWSLNGAPPGAPTALYAFGESMVYADQTFRFDVAFNLDASGRIVLMPVRTVANGLATSHTVGLQVVPAAFDELEAAPKDSYRRDSTLTVAAGQTVVMESADPAGCGTSFIASNIYAKFIVDEVDIKARTMKTRFVIDPNCGFRSFESGTPPWLK